MRPEMLRYEFKSSEVAWELANRAGQSVSLLVVLARPSYPCDIEKEAEMIFVAWDHYLNVSFRTEFQD